MNKLQLVNFANDITGKSVKFYHQIRHGKWYEQEFTSWFEEIELEQTYGVTVGDSSNIDYTFKVGKKVDNIFKTFVTQYINKYERKQSIGFEDGQFIYPTKKQCIQTLRNNDRVSKYYFYTTLYGIGYFCYFMTTKNIQSINENVGKYLTDNGITYSTEFSEAGWVTRFVINQKVEQHNLLLENFEL